MWRPATPVRPSILLWTRSGRLLQSGRVRREADRRRPRPVVGDHVDDGRLPGRRGALERGPDLVWLLAVLAVCAEVLRHLVVARVAEIAAGLVLLRIGGPSAVVADHAQDRHPVTDGGV